jgi:hypothetical protein
MTGGTIGEVVLVTGVAVEAAGTMIAGMFFVSNFVVKFFHRLTVPVLYFEVDMVAAVVVVVVVDTVEEEEEVRSIIPCLETSSKIVPSS